MLDLNIESQSLACMINDQNCLIDGLADIQPDYYTDPFYRAVFAKLKEMHESEKQITMLSVSQELGELAKGKGLTWLTVKDSFHSIATFKYYCDKLKDLDMMRKVEAIAQEAIKSVRNNDDVNSTIKTLENGVYNLSSSKEESKIITPKEIGMRMIDTIERRRERKSNGGIKSTINKLNYMMNGGIVAGQLVILGAKTGKGKTAFAMNLSKDWSIIYKQVGLYVNTEMEDEQIDCRFASMLTKDINIGHSKIANGLITDDEYDKVFKACQVFHESQLHVVTVNDLNINKLVSIARKFKSQKDIKYLVVDYIGRMETIDAKLPEHVVLYNIAKKLKTLAQELKITVLMLCQMNDDDKIEGAKKIRNEADLFCNLQERVDTNEHSNYFLCIEKNRDGAVGKIPLKFIGEKLTFIESV